jgi:hypothetical protein
MELDAGGCDVVHVVQASVIRAPQKRHAPWTTTMSNGSLWSVEKADHAASSCKSAGSSLGLKDCILFAKVRVAGSNPVVRSTEKARSEPMFVSAEWIVHSALY